MRVIYIVIGCVLMVALLIFLYRENTKGNYKYTITYNQSQYTCEDYTDEFVYLPNGTSIRYVNEFGDSVYRSGTFYIQKNKSK